MVFNRMDLKLLIVENYQPDAHLAIRELEKFGFRCMWNIVETEAALKISLYAEDWDIVLLDFGLPSMNPKRAFKIIRSINARVPVIIVSGEINEEIAMPFIEEGVHDFVGKSNLFRLPLAVKRELRHMSEKHRDRLRQQEYQNQILEAFGTGLEMRDHQTQGHTLRVTDMALRLTEKIGRRDLVHTVYRGSLLHDIGKIGVPDGILLKEGPLTDEEWVIMKQHPEFGRNMLKNLPFLSDAVNIPYCHHEKWDGSGYPQGLKGAEIPICARIFTIVDIYDALTTDRPYRKAISSEAALEEMNKHEHQFDPAIYAAFLSLLREDEGR